MSEYSSVMWGCEGQEVHYTEVLLAALTDRILGRLLLNTLFQIYAKFMKNSSFKSEMSWNIKLDDEFIHTDALEAEITETLQNRQNWSKTGKISEVFTI